MSYMRVDVAHHDRPAALNITTPQIQLSHDDLVQAIKSNNNNGPVKKFGADGCICDRGEEDIFCEMCGNTLRGRVKTACPYHQGVVHLMDIVVCPKCFSDKIRSVVPSQK